MCDCDTCLKSKDHGGDCNLYFINNCMYYEKDPRGYIKPEYIKKYRYTINFGDKIPNENTVLECNVDGKSKIATNFKIIGVEWNKSKKIAIDISYKCSFYENYIENYINTYATSFAEQKHENKKTKFEVIEGGKSNV